MHGFLPIKSSGRAVPHIASWVSTGCGACHTLHRFPPCLVDAQNSAIGLSTFFVLGFPHMSDRGCPDGAAKKNVCAVVSKRHTSTHTSHLRDHGTSPNPATFGLGNPATLCDSPRPVVMHDVQLHPLPVGIVQDRCRGFAPQGLVSIRHFRCEPATNPLQPTLKSSHGSGSGIVPVARVRSHISAQVGTHCSQHHISRRSM